MFGLSGDHPFSTKNMKSVNTEKMLKVWLESNQTRQFESKKVRKMLNRVQTNNPKQLQEQLVTVMQQ